MLYCQRCDRTYADRSVCPTCGLALVQRDDVEQDQELVAILTTSEVTLLPVVQSVLDAADVPYVIQGGEALGLLPLGPLSAGLFGDSLGASVLVPRSRVEEALELLRGCNIHEAGD